MEVTDEAPVDCSRLKSAVWSEYERIRKGGEMFAVCMHCRRELIASGTSGTSHLRNHLLRCKIRSNHDITPTVSRGRKKKKKKKDETLEVNGLSYRDAHGNSTALPNASTEYEHGSENDVIISTEGVNFDNKRSRLDLAHENSEALPTASTEYEHGSEEDVIISTDGVNFDNERSRLGLVRMIIIHGYSLDMVEDFGFRIFVRNLQPLFDMVTRDVVAADCEEIYQIEKQNLYEELKRVPGKISLSVDIWVANPDSKYFSLTAHYLDDTWQLKRKILNFVAIDPFQTADMLSEAIMTSVRNWDIDRKLFSVTFDSHSNYDNIARKIRDQLCVQRLLVCNGQLFDLRCAANVVNLMAEDALALLMGIRHKIRESIRYVLSSEEIHEKFKGLVKVAAVISQKSLCLDNRMQWNSSYIMLETALEYKDAFLILKDQDSLYSCCPTEEDWARASAITGFLKLFIEMSNVFAGNKFSTSNIFFSDICDIHLQLIVWCQNSDDFISSLALKMKSTFDDYWKKCSLALAISAVLDPRFKMKLVEYYYPQIYGSNAPACIDTVSKCMKALYDGHAISLPTASNGKYAGNGGVSTGDIRMNLSGFDKFVNETSHNHHGKLDLDKYLEEPLFPRNGDFNILNWWKVHSPRYPVLSMMARNILGIPLSKVPSEMLFCTEERAVAHSWSLLKPDILEALMCTQDWICSDLEG